MTVKTVPVGVLGTNCHILFSDDGKEALLVDPAYEPERILAALGDARVTHVVLTHGHFDHVGEAPFFRDRYGCDVLAADGSQPYFTDYLYFSGGGLVREKRFVPFLPDRFVREGETLAFDAKMFVFRILSGHTTADLCLEAGDTLVVGDVLFYDNVGRTDLPGGNAKQLAKSLARLMKYDDGTRVLPGHGDATTIGREKRFNEYIKYFTV